MKKLRKVLALTPCWTLEAISLKGAGRYLVAMKHASADSPKADATCGSRSAPIRLGLVENGRLALKRNLWLRCEQMEVDGEECSQIRLRLSLVPGGSQRGNQVWVRLAVFFEANLVGEIRALEKTFIYQLTGTEFQQRYRGMGDAFARFDLCRISRDSDCPESALMGECRKGKRVSYRLGKVGRHLMRKTTAFTTFVAGTYDLSKLAAADRQSIRPETEVRKRCVDTKGTPVVHKLPLERP